MGKARKLRREKERMEQSKTISQWIWSWGVVGAVILAIFVGGGYAFMTSGHPYIADMFFLIGAGLFLAKFLTWELPKKHERRKLVQVGSICITVLIIIGFAIYSNHYLISGKQPTAEEIANKVVEQLAKKEQKSLTNEFPEGYIIFGLMKPGEPLIKGFVPSGIEVNWNTGGVTALTEQIMVFRYPDIRIDRSNIKNMTITGNSVVLSRRLGAMHKFIGINDLTLQVKVIQATEPLIIALGLVKEIK